MVGREAVVGKKVFVSHEFEEDHVSFKLGRSGVIKKITQNALGQVIGLGIEWDFYAPSFHTCGGTTEYEKGYYIYQHNFNNLRMSSKIGNIGLYWGNR